jgi:hypothetical protein
VIRTRQDYSVHVRIVLDSSTLISLAWSAQLPLLARLPIEPVIINSVYAETVTEGHARGHADAAGIEHALAALTPAPDPEGRSVDAMVVSAAADVGALATNDVVIGRRAGNPGARWLRTGDLVLLGLASGSFDASAARRAIEALAVTGRITPQLRDEFMEDIA